MVAHIQMRYPRRASLMAIQLPRRGSTTASLSETANPDSGCLTAVPETFVPLCIVDHVMHEVHFTQHQTQSEKGRVLMAMKVH
ncbi:hypothetical protein Corgl_1356 [Coriobacterium glomerans PW2]|uniref:Uncharacterized protein n=1 Tax=Coriobacterium glomerans (strain ATCC 49209 / DSM 20642 / JCM 10262 / PW2) TaxID=700015 RepID=F2N8S4_CORGP|nr:hypothetical protein Corgl_1356 [Coriobacterium glomerans PW2]